MFRGFLLTIAFLLIAACAVSPTGRQQFLMLSPQELDTQGSQVFQEMKQQKPVVRDSRVNAYVGCVAQAIVRQVPGKWEVAVFRDDDVNAFAVPGGKIGVNTGLFKVARNQDQLAAVIGHEVGHVLANHVNERMSQEGLVQLGLGLGQSLADPSSSLQRGFLAALGLGAQVGFLLPYSRLHESEADVIGMDLMARSGFDPRAALDLWQNMAREGGAEPPEFLSTHPSHGTRLQDLQANLGTAMRTYQAALAQGRRPRCSSP